MSTAVRFKQAVGLRPKPSTNLPVGFMQDHIDSDLSPTIATPPLEYASELSAFVGPERRKEIASQEDALFSDAKVHLQELREAVLRYQQKLGPKSRDASLASKETCTWTEVQAEIQITISEQGTDDESNKAALACSKMRRHIPAFEAWLSLLPDGDYGAVISGVFKVVVIAAKRANDIQIAILKALADIPESIARAAEYREMYEKERPLKLTQTTAQLCKAVLIALRHIVMHFVEGNVKSGIKAVFQGPSYKKTLQSYLDEVQELATKVDREANFCSQHSILNIEEYVKSIEKAVRELQRPQTVEMDEVNKQDLTARIGDYLVERVVNRMFGHISSSDGINPRITQVVGLGDLLLLLETSDRPDHDMRRCLAHGKVLGLEDQDRAKWVMRSRHFQDWLNHPASKTILINGNCDGMETFSPLTFLSAKILEGLETIEPIITLKFFCSLHATGQENSNAVGMMKSFITQLLQQDLTWNLASLSREDVDHLKADDLKTLCRVFHYLLRQLPHTTFVYLVIDGLTFYERTDKRQDFMKAIDEILNIVDACKNIVVKLLLAGHGRSFFVKDYVEDEDSLTVPTIVDGDRQGWSDERWNRSMEVV